MPFGNLPTQTSTIPFAAGLNTKGDKRAQNPPMLDICKDVEFDDVGGLRTRYPFSSLGANIFGGGTISNARKLATRDGEILLFTDTALYSWDSIRSVWINRGTHLAIDLAEEMRFATNGDQITCDRAELSGTVILSWVENAVGYVAAASKATGTIVMSPTALPGSASRLRLTALTTKILLTFYDGVDGLYCYALDPANPATALAGASTTLTNTNYNIYYDVVKVPGADQAVFACRRNPVTSYLVGTVTAGLSVATSVKARQCSGPIAVSPTPDGAQFQIARDFGNNAGTYRIRGDLLTSALVDVYTDQEIGTYTIGAHATADQLTCAHRSVQNSGQYRCYVFWAVDEDRPLSAAMLTKSNWVDTGNNLGTQALFQPWCSIGSRAFNYNGSVYCWIVFNSTTVTSGYLQGVYVLFRDDGFLAAASRVGNAWYSGALGYLPGVALTSGSTTFSWSGAFVRKVDETGNTSFHTRAPRDMSFTFDSNNARRCAQLGSTLAISGSPVLQYDGVQLTELGFLVGAYWMDYLGDVAGGSMAAATYGYKATLRSMNATGENDRSTSFIFGSAIVSASSHKAQFNDLRAIWTTRKNTVAWEIWRTAANPTEDAPYYRVTSNDPTAAGPNGYIANSKTSATNATFEDAESDAAATISENFPENGGVLENVPPPPASIVIASDTRLFLAGIAGDPDRVWYSKQRIDGQVAGFHDALTIQVPPAGGNITALAILNNTLIVFRERAVYALPGDGFDNTSGGSNYGPARILSTEFGAVNQESVALIPDGLIFKSDKGWCSLSRAWSVDDKIGLPVAAYDNETPLAVSVMESQRQVRVLTANRMLVYDWLVNQWGEWTISDGLDATLWNGTHHYLTSTGPKAQQSTYAGVNYGYDVETCWIKVNDLQGRGIVRAIEVLGEFRAASAIRARLARNYQSDGAGGWSYFQDKTWVVTPTVVGGPLQEKIAPSIKRPIQAIKLRLTALAADGVSAPSDDTTRLTGLSLAVAVEDGLYSGLPAAQKA